MPSRWRGFTLLEVLVVVVIAGILGVVVVLRLGHWGSSDDPVRQLERLGALIEAQCQHALLQARPRGVRITDQGYDFWQGTTGGWQRLEGDGVDRPRTWTGSVGPDLILDGRRPSLKQAVPAPQIVCQPLGELTPFELTLQHEQRQWRLAGRGDGRLEYRWP